MSAVRDLVGAELGPTAWQEIIDLYDLLLTIAPTPGAILARAVAVAEAAGPEATDDEGEPDGVVRPSGGENDEGGGVIHDRAHNLKQPEPCGPERSVDRAL